MRGQPGFFDIDDRLKRLSDLGDQLATFPSAVDFALFRPEFNAVLSYTDRSEGGRPPFDPVLMFKILVIQATNNLSDERAEFLINDRLSFMRFLGLGLEDRVPDARVSCRIEKKYCGSGSPRYCFRLGGCRSARVAGRSSADAGRHGRHIYADLSRPRWEPPT